MPRRSRHGGFTLLELLVAMAIFALMAVLAYGGLHQVLAARDVSDHSAKRLARLQTTLLMLERDVDQTVDRGVRDAYGDSRPALQGDEGGLTLTRGGWSNPLGADRSNLQRVSWRLVDGALQRADWKVLDRAQDSAPYRATLLTDVVGFRVRFLDRSRQWQNSWPPQSTLPGAVVATTAGLPLAVEVTVELRDWGPVVRLLPLADGVPATGKVNG